MTKFNDDLQLVKIFIENEKSKPVETEIIIPIKKGFGGGGGFGGKGVGFGSPVSSKDVMKS